MNERVIYMIYDLDSLIYIKHVLYDRIQTNSHYDT